MPEAKILVGLPVGSLIAPAGHGKTEAIVKTAALGERTLVLTHTHAGVHALRGRLKRLGVPSGAAHVDTIDGWCMRYVRAFPKRGHPPPGMPTGAEWAALRRNALNVLQVSGVQDVVQSSYGRILVDEYQDCDPGQHALTIALSRIVPTVVFGDPMQGIFEFADARLRWQRDVYPTFPLAMELNEPRRWQSKNPALGAWIAETRQRLIRGERIDLESGPITFLRTDDAFDMGAFFEGIGEREGSVAAIHCRRGMCDKLARATRGMFQSIEEVAAKRLSAFASAWDASTDGEQRLRAILDLSSDCFHKRPKQEGEELPPDGARIIEEMKAAASQLDGSSYPEAARALMQLARRHPRWRVFRGELWRDSERALAELAAQRSDALCDAVLKIRHRVTASGRSLARRTISTPLLLKGLEFDHVIVPDAGHFGNEDYAQAKLFYVAISRATQSLTIAARDRYIQFPRPAL
jgi:superfamily I DNA/RNA helicase